MTRPLCVTNYAQQSLCVMEASSVTHNKVCAYSMTDKYFMSEAWVVSRTPAKSGGLPNNLLTLPTKLRSLPANLPTMPGLLPAMVDRLPTKLFGEIIESHGNGHDDCDYNAQD